MSWVRGVLYDSNSMVDICYYCSFNCLGVKNYGLKDIFVNERSVFFVMCLFNRYPVLRLYDKGPKVKEASLLLAKHGSSLKPTDYFSIAMRSAVMAFQKKHGLMQIPMIDKATWKALKKKHKAC